MAIFGVGANWEGEDLRPRFFAEGKFILGWNETSAKDLYSSVAALKVGDILYIKRNSPGSRSVKIMGIGVVTKNFMSCIMDGEFGTASFADWESLFVRVAWIFREVFVIDIPASEGRLTNIRAATIYEEFLPLVQVAIVNKVIGI
jgi:hypothetical protein